ncbi:twin-arginine translocation pathway signal sequence domain protein [Aureimonas sp. SA4125]|uniref:alpha/beta hydrolase n=1 Tax=Aureimonas sp. SA4125 TaxID=2826993 RepID=UPI001CC3A09A|nr:alpha/beta hydrolase [Aureimonas sp. SA4125]BDA86778.1 twin-arginine translocation pathway signal sequence domain protein [Aureimonas sp. SA4125]
MARILVDRRSFIAMAALAEAPAVLTAPSVAALPRNLPLWPGEPPGGRGLSGPGPGPERMDGRGALSHVSRPRLVVHRPAEPSRRTDTAVIVVAGGGYGRIEAGRESVPACRWLQARGITAFELIYRLPGEGWSVTAPFADGQRAMRLVRAGGFERIGMLGFSAGAHLAGMTAVRPDAGYQGPVDAADAQSARPDFVGLVYPVLSMMPPVDGTRARHAILGRHPGRAEAEAFSVERLVGADTPPVFLAQSADDPVAPIDNSLMMYNALGIAGVPAALHVFATGGHGWGMGRAGGEPADWSALFADWMDGTTG